MTTKSFAKSKTIWGALIAALPTLAQSVGVDIGQGPVTLDTVNNLGDPQVSTILEAAGGVLVLWGRMTAKAALGLKGDSKP